MCTADEGVRMQNVFYKYIKGRPVEEEDVPALKSLSMASYIRFYMDDGVLFAGPGPIGSMIKAPAVEC
ncbi:MAG: hypothetical protein E7Z69_00880 [Thermoplasmata archaeon]|jgi:hypothetical protein|nr:hypothetical protein [Thermoplasmata archaeon]